jgi:uncharacterized membrane protein YccC
VSTRPPSPAAPDPEAVATGLRVAMAATACVLVTESLHLDLGYMSVYVALNVLVVYPSTSFRHGAERLLGQVTGVAYGLTLVQLFRTIPPVFLLLLTIGQTAAFYVYLSRRPAYVSFLAGLFMPTVAYLGLTADPAAAVPTATALIAQVTLGVSAATLISVATGAKPAASIEAGGATLFPLRADLASQALMLSITSVGTMLVTLALGLPVIPTVASGVLLAATPGPRALGARAWQRILGVVFGGGYSIPAVWLLSRMSYLPLLLALLALGLFTAAYCARASAAYGYIGRQSGILVGTVMVSPTDDYGRADPAVQRFIGIMVALVISLAVQAVWEAVREKE